MAGKKSTKKSSKSKSSKKVVKDNEPKTETVKEEIKEEKDYASLVNIPKHGWIKLEVKYSELS